MSSIPTAPEFIAALTAACLDRDGRHERDEVRFRCPAPGHPDRHPSARWNAAKAVWRCDVCGASGGGLDLGRLLGISPPVRENAARANREPMQLVATYPYRDEAGELLFEVKRYRLPDGQKTFRQRKPDGHGGWTYRLGDARRVLYRLPELTEADPSRRVFICEGEKDADRLAACGLVATTNPHGAGKWRSEYSESLRDRRVAILPDNDDPGRAHAGEVAAQLMGIAAEVRIVSLPDLPGKGDVSDWLDAGGTLEDLQQLVKHAPRWSPEPHRFRSGPIDSMDSAVPGTESMKSMDETGIYGGVVLAGVQPETITWLSPGRLAAGKLAVLDGDPGLGKSSLTLDWAARISTGRALPDGQPAEPRGVVLLSAEDGLADTIVPRLIAMGADLVRIVALPDIPTPDGPRGVCLPDDIPIVEHLVTTHDAALTIIDPLMAYLGARTNSYRDQDVRRTLAPLAAMGERTGCAILLVRHLNKGSQQGTQPLYRGGGSIGIIGAARTGLLVAADPDDPERRVLASTKCNLARSPASLAFALTSAADGQTATIAYLGDSGHRAADLLRQDDPEDRSLRDAAGDWLREMLASGPMPARDLKREAERAGFTRTTLQTAKERLGVTIRRNGFGKGSVVTWALPELADAAHRFRPGPIDAIDTAPGKAESMASMGETGIFGRSPLPPAPVVWIGADGIRREVL